MAQNIGTLVTAAIRPNDSLDLIASAFANEIKGGLHTVTASSDRDLIIEARRDWEMLVNVINDGKTYQLKYNHVNTTITDNNNWVIYSPGGVDTSEWVDSVQQLSTSPSTLTTDGYRYLVDVGGSGLFAGEDGKIATWNLATSTFAFVTPTDGQTLRVDNIKNIIFKFQGTFGSGGKWVREYVNQVRYLGLVGDGQFYGVTSSLQNSIDSYSFSVFYCNFDVANTGTVSVSIDTLPYIEVKKLENNTFSSLLSGDIVTGVNYQLVLNDSGFFQTTLPSSTTTTIGSAEDGSYLDGLYTDFVPSTPIGTAVDRFNEILKYLVPSPAPSLTSWSATGSFVNGALSFDNSTSGSLITATSSPYGSVSKGETFSSLTNSYRLGITSKVSQPLTGTTYYQDITGILNSNVVMSSQTPTPAYVTYSFGNANVGTVSMILNGTTIASVSLTYSTSFNTTNSGATSGLIISSPTSSFFSTGYPFDTFQNRTGTFLIKKNSPDIVDGYNYVIVRHDTPSTSYILNRYEWVADSNVLDISVINPQINSVTTPTKKYLSGIEFYTGVIRFYYDTTIQNVFGNTYNTSSSAVTYRDLSTSLSNPTNTITNTTTNSDGNNILSPSLSTGPIVVNGSYDPTSTMLASMTFSVNSNRRRINDNVGFGLIVLRTVQGTFTGGTSSLTSPVTGQNWFIDTYSPTSTTFSESFDDENYRLKNLSSKYSSYNLVTDVTNSTNYWTSSHSLYADADAKNGLQVINGLLVYPNISFNTLGSAISNPNVLGSSRDYSNCGSLYLGFGTSSSSSPTNYRSYTRWFYFGGTPGSTSVFNFVKAKLNVTSTSTTFVKSDVALTGNNAWLEIKLPYGSAGVSGGTQPSGSITGWLDATQPFNNSYGDGAGCLSGALPTTSGSDWLLDFGQKGTQYSNGYVLLRITVAPSYVGNISQVNLLGRV